MQTLAYFLIGTVDAILMALQIAMFLRAILSWFMDEGSSKFSAFLYAITEPVIIPVRALCDRMGWFQDFPLDIPFFITYILLAMISAGLSMM